MAGGGEGKQVKLVIDASMAAKWIIPASPRRRKLVDVVSNFLDRFNNVWCGSCGNRCGGICAIIVIYGIFHGINGDICGGIC